MHNQDKRQILVDIHMQQIFAGRNLSQRNVNLHARRPIKKPPIKHDDAAQMRKEQFHFGADLHWFHLNRCALALT